MVNHTHAYRQPRQHPAGMSLLELLIAVTLSILLLLGIVQITSAAASSTRLQRNQAQLQENARLAVMIISRHVREAGFNPEPWLPKTDLSALTDDNADDLPGGSDRLSVRNWSDLNCFDNRNPILDAQEKPAFHIREVIFDLNTSKNLTWQCRYGPTPSEMVTQVRRQGLVENVESFQLLYGEDTNQDRVIDRWVNAGQWGSPRQILGMRIGLLLVSEDEVTEKTSRQYRVLHTMSAARTDGRLRRVYEFAAAIRSRTG
ncbi:MAG: PilW family protein [Desulfuromonadales bacterium]|jgi:type IV pilus assembly protein PilW